MIRNTFAFFPRSSSVAVAAVAAVTAAAFWISISISISSAYASEPQLSNNGRAEVLFRSGEKKFDSGDYQGACADFTESIKLGPKLGTLLNLALCHETTGKLVTAWSEFHHGAAWAAQNGQRDRLEFAKEHIRSLEGRLPRIVLNLPAERAISGIDIDGEPVPEPRWYLPLYLDPGEHMLAVTAPGKERTTVAFRVILAPTDQIVSVPSLPDAKPQPGSFGAVDQTKRFLGLVGLGVGVMGLAVGTTFGVLAITRDDGDSSAIKDNATGATIGFVAGAVFAGAGGYLLWTSGSRGIVHAGIAPRPGGASLGVGATF
jgi:hypothetical protein